MIRAHAAVSLLLPVGLIAIACSGEPRSAQVAPAQQSPSSRAEVTTVSSVPFRDRRVGIALVRVDTLQPESVATRIIRLRNSGIEGIVLVPEKATSIDVRLALRRLGETYLELGDSLTAAQFVLDVPAAGGIEFVDDPIGAEIANARQALLTLSTPANIAGYGSAIAVPGLERISNLLGRGVRVVQP